MPGFQRNDMQSEPLVFSLELGIAKRVEEPWSRFAHPVKIQYANRHNDSEENLGSSNENIVDSDIETPYASPDNSAENLHTHFDLCPPREEIILTNEPNLFTSASESYSSTSFNQTEPYETFNEGLRSPVSLDYGCHGYTNLQADIIDHEVENIFNDIKNLNKNLENMADSAKTEEKDSGILYTFEEITSEENSDKDANNEQFNSDFKPRQKLLLGGNLLHDIASHDTGVAWGNKTLGKSSENNHALLQHQRDACETNTLQKDGVCFEKSSDKKDDKLLNNGADGGDLLLKEPFDNQDDSLVSIEGENNNDLFNLKGSSNVDKLLQNDIVDMSTSDPKHFEFSDGLSDKQSQSVATMSDRDFSKTEAVDVLSEDLEENQLMTSFDDNFMSQMLDKIVSKVTGSATNSESEDSKPNENVSEENKNANSESINSTQTSNELNISVSENTASAANIPNLIENDKQGLDKKEAFAENEKEKTDSNPEYKSPIPEKSLKILEPNPENFIEKPEAIPENFLEKSEAINVDLEGNKSSQRIDDKSKPIDKNIEENITSQRNKEELKPIDKSIPENKTSPKKSGKGKQKGGTAKLTSYLKGLAKKHKPAAQKATESIETINSPSSSLPSAKDKNVKVEQKITTQTSGIISSQSDNESNPTNENKLENYSKSDSRSERPVDEGKNDLFTLPSASVIQSGVHGNDLSPLVNQEESNFSSPFDPFVATDTKDCKNGNPDLSQDGSTLNDAVTLINVSSSEEINPNQNSLFSLESKQSESGNENQNIIQVQPTESSSTITEFNEQINDSVSSTVLTSENESKSTAITITTNEELITDAISCNLESTVTSLSSAINNIDDPVSDVIGSVSETTSNIASVSNDIKVPVTDASISSGIHKPKTGNTDIALLNTNDIKDMPLTSSEPKPSSMPQSSLSLNTTNEDIELNTRDRKSSEDIDSNLSSSSPSSFFDSPKGHTSPLQVETNDSSTQFLSPNGSSVNTGEVKQEEITETQACAEAGRRNIDLKLDADDDCQTWNEEQKDGSTSTSTRNKSQEKNDETKILDSFFKSLKASPKKPKESKKMSAEDAGNKKDITLVAGSSDEICSAADNRNQPVPPNTDENKDFESVGERDVLCDFDTEEKNLSEMSQVKDKVNDSSELTGNSDMLDASVSMALSTNVTESLDSKPINLESSKSITELSQSVDMNTDKVCNLMYDSNNSHFNPLLDILDNDEMVIESCGKEPEILEFGSDLGISKSLSKEEPSLQSFETSDNFISENKTSENEYLSKGINAEENVTGDIGDISASTPNKELFSDDVFDTTTPISVVSGHSYLFETSPSDSDIQSLSSPRYDTEQSPGSLICDSGFLSQHSLSDDGRLDDIATPEPITKLSKNDSESDLIGSDLAMVSEETGKESKRTVAMKTENSFDEELFEVNPSIIDECLDIQGNYYESTPIREQSIMEEEESYVSVSPVNDAAEPQEEGGIEVSTQMNKDKLEVHVDSESESNPISSADMVSHDENSEENEMVESEDGEIQENVDHVSKKVLEGFEEKQKEVDEKPSEEEIIEDQLSSGLSESIEKIKKEELSEFDKNQIEDSNNSSETFETKSTNQHTKEIQSEVKEVVENKDEYDGDLDFEKAERLNMELMEKLQANQAHLLAIHHHNDGDDEVGDDDKVGEDSDNAVPGDSSEFRELDEENKLPQRPSSLPYYAKNSVSEMDTESSIPDKSSQPSTLPSYAKGKAEPEEKVSISFETTQKHKENVDTTEKTKVPKYKQGDENYSFSEFDEDLKLEPVSNIRKMFEKENSPVPSPQSSPVKSKSCSPSKSPQKSDCDSMSANAKAISISASESRTCDKDSINTQRNNKKGTEILGTNDVCDNDNKFSTENLNDEQSVENENKLDHQANKNNDEIISDEVSEGNYARLDDQTNQNVEEIISGATPSADVAKPSVSVRNMLKMWEDNRRRDSHDLTSPIKPFNKLSKKWHSCGHIYFKSDNMDDSTTSVTVDEDLAKYGVGDSGPTKQRHKLKDTKPQQDGGQRVTTTTKKETVTEVKGEDKRGGVSSMKIQQETTTVSAPKSSTIHQNGVDTTVTQQTTRQEIRQTETTRTMAAQQNNYQDFEEDEDDEGVYENVPAAPRTDVFRETDSKIDVELPQASTARNMRERFLKLAEESAAGNRTADKELTPPPAIRGPVEAGVFESQPEPSRNDVYHYTEQSKEVVTEKGKALNTVQRYKEIASREFKGPANKRDITPDRSGVVEYVSEPRAEHLTYEEKPLEAGIFESQPTTAENVSRYEDYVPDELPQQGTARNIASRFHEIERNATLPPAPANRREVTPDRHGRGEYVSEPRAQHLTYEEKVEGGIYENQPAPVRTDIYRHEEYYQEEPLPEKGYAKNIVSRFKEIEKNAHVHQKTIQRLSPPKESKAVVYENEPSASPVAYKETVKEEDILPERGQARNLASRFKQIEQENLKARAGNRQVKEFTPPKDERTVFESQPSQSNYKYEEREVEHGILESRPAQREDVCRESDPKNFEVELPERGAAKNLLSRWKQIESSSNRGSPPTPGRVKEFTPPREEERIKELRSPKNVISPTGPGNSVHPNDLPGQYQPKNEPTVFESQPAAPREDLFRESDTNWAAGLPKANKTKKVLAKFQAIQSKAQSSPVSPANRKTKKGGMFMPVQNEKCGACQKTVYAMEKVEMNKNAYHRACFKCSQCSTILTPKTFAINAGTMFCTSHYKQLFARKGNYDEGFGRQQHKKKWKSESNLLDKELIDMEHEIEA